MRTQMMTALLLTAAMPALSAVGGAPRGRVSPMVVSSRAGGAPNYVAPPMGASASSLHNFIMTPRPTYAQFAQVQRAYSAFPEAERIEAQATIGAAVMRVWSDFSAMPRGADSGELAAIALKAQALLALPNAQALVGPDLYRQVEAISRAVNARIGAQRSAVIAANIRGIAKALIDDTAAPQTVAEAVRAEYAALAKPQFLRHRLQKSPSDAALARLERSSEKDAPAAIAAIADLGYLAAPKAVEEITVYASQDTSNRPTGIAQMAEAALSLGRLGRVETLGRLARDPDQLLAVRSAAFGALLLTPLAVSASEIEATLRSASGAPLVAAERQGIDPGPALVQMRMLTDPRQILVGITESSLVSAFVHSSTRRASDAWILMLTVAEAVTKSEGPQASAAAPQGLVSPASEPSGWRRIEANLRKAITPILFAMGVVLLAAKYLAAAVATTFGSPLAVPVVTFAAIVILKSAAAWALDALRVSNPQAAQGLDAFLVGMGAVFLLAALPLPNVWINGLLTAFMSITSWSGFFRMVRALRVKS